MRQTPADHPLRLANSFQRLPDGHTSVVNWLGYGHLGTTAQFFEVDAEKKLVREFTDHRRFTSVNEVQVLDVPGDPAMNEVLPRFAPRIHRLRATRRAWKEEEEGLEEGQTLAGGWS